MGSLKDAGGRWKSELGGVGQWAGGERAHVREEEDGLT